MTPQSAAQILWDAAARGEHFPEALQGRLDVTAGYRTQQEMLARHLANGEVQGGWKIGFTAPAVREQFNSDAPVFGYLLESRGFSSGLSFSFGDMINPALESELCFTIGKPLKGPGITREQVQGAIAAVTPALEIIELRGNAAQDLGLGIADDVMQWGWVLGPDVRPYPKDLDLGAVHATIRRNGAVVGDHIGRDVIDDQLASLAWLANALADYGAGLRPGQRVLTGSFGRPLPISRGERWETVFEGLGTVAARFD